MRAFVFTDKSLASEAGRFVWLEIDTEKAKNASVRKQLAVAALPSFFILDPADERVALRWVGGATVPALTRILDDGRAAVTAGTVAAGRGGLGSPADSALARADDAYGRADYATAAAGYREALKLAPAGWSSDGRTVESLLYALNQTDGYEEGASLALAAYPRLARTPSAPNVAASGLDCALSLPADHPRRAELVAALDQITRAVAEDLTLSMAADDRSGVYITPARTPTTAPAPGPPPRRGRRSWTARPRRRRRPTRAWCSTRTGSRPTSSWGSPSERSRCSKPRSATPPATTILRRGSPSPTRR